MPRRPHPFRFFVLTIGGVLLAWLVITGSLVAYLAVAAPEAALWLSPGDPEALLNLAERSLQDAAKTLDEAREGGAAGSQSGAPAGSLASAAAEVALDEARGRAETALANDPVNARALRLLGQIAHVGGDTALAARYMQAAARRWVHESAALFWLVRDSYARKDYGAALDFADALLRTQPPALAVLLPTLAAIAETPDARAGLEKLLATNPPWRRAFFAELPRAVSDARTPLILLLAMRETAAPATFADARGYIGALVEIKRYELAYYTWLQLLPPGQLAGAGALFNGSFEHAPSGLPFDWTMQGGSGVTLDIAPRPDALDQRALFIELGPGRVELRGVEQTLLLAPGSYRFQGKYQGELAGPRGLVWRVSCAGAGGAPLGQSPMMIGAAPVWKDIALAFTVPAAGCRAQQLQLVLDARMPSEQLVTGSVWLDDLSIARAD